MSERDITNETPGFHALVAEQFDALRVLVEQGLPLEAKNEHDQTLLHVAAYWGHLEATKYLVYCFRIIFLND